MQSAFGTVLWVVCGAGLVLAFLSLIGSGKVWEEYGRSRLLMESDLLAARGARTAAIMAGSDAERDAEIRQLLEARNARRARRGEAPVDVEAEFERLMAPSIDEGLRAEIRELVVARNFRLMRAGKPTLDVDAEVQRQIASLRPEL